LPIPANVEGAKFGKFEANVAYDSPHVKTFFLLQAHMMRIRSLPCSDYVTDTKSVLDQVLRVLHAMVDVSADEGYLSTTLGIMTLMQCVKQAQFPTDFPLAMLLHSSASVNKVGKSLSQILEMNDADLVAYVNGLGLSSSQARDTVNMLMDLPSISMQCTVLRKKPSPVKDVVELYRDEEVELRVSLSRKRKSRRQDLSVYSKYPKLQYEGWWLVLGDSSTDELIAVKRIGSGQTKWDASLSFVGEGDGRRTLTCWLMSDAYVGVDVVQKIELLVL